MEYLVGIGVALAVAALGAIVGFDRERSFGTTILIVVASYYVLFAAIGGSTPTLMAEVAMAAVFLLLAVVSFKSRFWLLPVAMVGHGVFDSFHGFLVHNAGMPSWWPGFCMTFDVLFGAWLAVKLVRSSSSLSDRKLSSDPEHRNAST